MLYLELLHSIIIINTPGQGILLSRSPTLLEKRPCILYVCVRGVMGVVFFVCIVRGGAVGARVWEV